VLFDVFSEVGGFPEINIWGKSQYYEGCLGSFVFSEKFKKFLPGGSWLANHHKTAAMHRGREWSPTPTLLSRSLKKSF